MNFKKSLLALSAVFVSLSAFAGNTPDIRPVFGIQAEPTFTQENSPAATAYAYTRFFDAFAARVAAGDMTAEDEKIVSVVEKQMLPAFLAVIKEAEENIRNPQTDEQVNKARENLINLLVKEFDLQEINTIISHNQNGAAPVFTVSDLHKPVLNLAAADLAISYLSAKGEISVEEQIVLEIIFRESK